MIWTAIPMPPNKPIDLEICVETAQGIAAAQGQADRIELCSGLGVGGLTPSLGLMEMARDSGLETHVLIRPRSGDFEMDARDLELCLKDISTVRDCGLHGVVIGAVRDQALDKDALSTMCAAAEGLVVTLHRAIDVVADPLQALDIAVDLGMARILTSGGAENAVLGRAVLAELCSHAAGRIDIMAGGGITPGNVAALLADADIDAIHASCGRKILLPDAYGAKGFGATRNVTDSATIKALAAAISAQVEGQGL